MPSTVPFAPNVYGVTTAPLDSSAPDFPAGQTYHGFFMVEPRTQALVGRLQSFQTTHYSRGGTHVYELNAFTAGHPVEYIPTIADQFMAHFVHGELWNGEIELALGYPAVFADLTDQTSAFELEEWLQRGKDLYRIWRYSGCWFRSKNREEHTVSGDYQIKIRGDIAFVNVAEV